MRYFIMICSSWVLQIICASWGGGAELTAVSRPAGVCMQFSCIFCPPQTCP